MVAILIFADAVPLTFIPHIKEGKGVWLQLATPCLSYLTAREWGGVQSESLLTPTSCFSYRDVPSPWRPNGTGSLSVPFPTSPVFKGVTWPQEISLRSLRGNQSISQWALIRTMGNCQITLAKSDIFLLLVDCFGISTYCLLFLFFPLASFLISSDFLVKFLWDW